MFSSELLGDWGGDGQEKAENSADKEIPDDTTPALGSGFSFWSVAAAVSSTVRKQASELVSSVAETDWKTELSAFSKEVSHDTHVLGSNALHMVDHLPGLIEHLPEQAERALPAVAAHSKDMSHTLEAVGSSITQLGRSLLIGGKEIIEQVKDAVESEIAAATKTSKRGGRPQRGSPAAQSGAGGTPAKYSRFDAEVSAMQRDSSTYCDEPEEREEYGVWKASFRLEGASGEIDKITRDNPFMAELQSRIVPLIVEHDDFWHRYFYRLHKLQQKEEQRQQVAQMAKAMPAQEEELGWDDLEEEMAKAMPAEGGEEEDDDASLADSADIEAELRNLTPSPDPDKQGAAGLASPQQSGSALEQEALTTPAPTLKAPASAVEEMEEPHAPDALVPPHSTANPQPQPHSGEAPAAAAGDAAAAPSTASAAPSASEQQPAAPTGPPAEATKPSSAPTAATAATAAPEASPLPQAVGAAAAAAALVGIAAEAAAEDSAESASSQDAAPPAQLLQKEPSIDTTGSDTSREWSLVSASAGSTATSPSAASLAAVAAAVDTQAAAPGSPAAAAAESGGTTAGSSQGGGGAVGADGAKGGAKGGVEGGEEGGDEEDGEDDDDLDLEGLGEDDDDGADDGEAVDEDWGSWN